MLRKICMVILIPIWLLIMTSCNNETKESPEINLPLFNDNSHELNSEFAYDYHIPFISGGEDQALIIDDFGDLWLLGRRREVDFDNYENMFAHEPEKIMGGVVTALCTWGRSMVLKQDGSVLMWGYDMFDEPTEIIRNARAIYLDNLDGYIFLNDGTLWRLHTRFFFNDKFERQTEIKLEKVFDDVKEIFFESNATFIIKKDNTLWGYGNNDGGILGNGLTSKRQLEPVKILENVKSVSCHFYHTLAVTNNNELWGWGYNGNGQLIDDSKVGTVLYPQKLIDNVEKAYTYNNTSYAIKEDGSLIGWGDNKKGELGDGTYEPKKYHVKILDNISDLYLSRNSTTFYAYALNNNGNLYSWGDSVYSGKGRDLIYPQIFAEEVKFISRHSINNSYPSFVKKDSSIWVWGNDPFFKSGYSLNKTDYRITYPVEVVFKRGEEE